MRPPFIGFGAGSMKLLFAAGNTVLVEGPHILGVDILVVLFPFLRVIGKELLKAINIGLHARRYREFQHG